jgi:DHA1 family tetracycline resistance protein-like MFS transporter
LKSKLENPEIEAGMATTTTATNPYKLDFKRILPIFVIVLVDLLGLTIIIPLLPLYAATFGADPLTIGMLGTAYPLMQLIGAPLLGGLSDRYGRKPVLLVSQFGTFAGFLLLGFANALPLLFLSRLIDGISGANIVAAQAAVTDSTTETTRAQGLGLIGAAFGLGFTLGPAMAGIALAVSGNDYRVPALLAAGFSLLSIILTAVWFKETLPIEKRGQTPAKKSVNTINKIVQALANPAIGTLLLLMFMQQLVFGGFENLLPLFTLSRLGLNGSGNAVIFVFVGVILVLVQGKYIGPWSRKYGERKLIYVGLGLLAVGLVLTAITPSQPAPWYSQTELLAEMKVGDTIHSEVTLKQIEVPLPEDGNNGWLGLAWIMVAMIPASIGGGILSPAINSLITRRVSGQDIGGTLGVSSALVSLANAATPLIGGAIFQFIGSTAPFLIGGLVLAGLMGVAIQKITPGAEEKLTPAAAN